MRAGTTSDGEPDTLAVLDALTLLVERSLVVVERGSATRYRLLETIRQYARDRLVESGETDAIRSRHLAFFLDLGQRAEREMRGPEFTDWLQRLDTDADNLRLAIDWGLESDPGAGDPAVRRALAAVAGPVGRRARGLVRPGGRGRPRAAASLRPKPDSSGTSSSPVVCSEAAFTQATWTDRDARALADEGLARARATGDLATISQGLAAAWTARLFAGRPEELLALGRGVGRGRRSSGRPMDAGDGRRKPGRRLVDRPLALGGSGARQIAHGGCHAVRSDERRWVRDGVRGAHPRSHRGCGRADR